MSFSSPRTPPAFASTAVRVVQCALVVRLLDEWWSYLPAGTIDDQVRDLGLSYGQSGWLLALLTLGGVAGSPIAALADRGHRRALACSGAGCIALALCAFAAAAPYPVLVMAAVLLGASSDAMIRPLESSLADIADHAEASLDRLLGRQHLISWLGDFVAPALLALGAVSVIGWRGVFGLTAVVFVAFGVVLARTAFPPPDPHVANADEPLLRSAHTMLRTPEVWWLVAAEFVLLPLDEAFLGFAVARSAADGSGAVAQLLAGGLVVGGILGSLIVSRRGLDPTAIRWGCSMLVAGAVATALPAAFAVQLVALAAVGGGTAIVWAKVHHRTLTLVPGRSATTSTMVGLLSTPALLVPVTMGLVADAASITMALVATATLSFPLAIAVLRLGGGRVTAEELEEIDDD